MPLDKNGNWITEAEAKRREQAKKPKAAPSIDLSNNIYQRKGVSAIIPPDTPKKRSFKVDSEVEAGRMNPEFAKNHPTMAKGIVGVGNVLSHVFENPWVERSGQTGAEIMTMTDMPNKPTTGSGFGDVTADLAGALGGFLAGGEFNVGSKLWQGAEQGIKTAAPMIPGLRNVPTLIGKGTEKIAPRIPILKNIEGIAPKAKTVAEYTGSIGGASVPWEATRAYVNDREISPAEMGMMAGVNVAMDLGIMGLTKGLARSSRGTKPAKPPVIEERSGSLDYLLGEGSTPEARPDYAPWVREDLVNEFQQQRARELPGILTREQDPWAGMRNTEYSQPWPDYIPPQGVVPDFTGTPYGVYRGSPRAELPGVPERLALPGPRGTIALTTHEMKALPPWQRTPKPPPKNVTPEGEVFYVGPQGETSINTNYLKELSTKYNDLIDSEVIRMKGELGGVASYRPDEYGPLMRATQNPTWYRNFWQKHLRAPREGEWRDLAIKNLMEGNPETGEPANDEFLAIMSELSRGQRLPEEWHGIQRTIRDLEGSKGEYVPEESTGELDSLLADMRTEQGKVEPYGLTRDMGRLSEAENAYRGRMEDKADFGQYEGVKFKTSSAEPTPRPDKDLLAAIETRQYELLREIVKLEQIPKYRNPEKAEQLKHQYRQLSQLYERERLYGGFTKEEMLVQGAIEIPNVDWKNDIKIIEHLKETRAYYENELRNSADAKYIAGTKQMIENIDKDISERVTRIERAQQPAGYDILGEEGTNILQRQIGAGQREGIPDIQGADAGRGAGTKTLGEVESQGVLFEKGAKYKYADSTAKKAVGEANQTLGLTRGDKDRITYAADGWTPEMELADKAANALSGTGVIPVKMPSFMDKFQGFFEATNRKIFVNKNTKDPVTYVSLHETVHRMKETHPEHYNPMAEVAINNLKEEHSGLIKRYLDRGYDIEEIPEEFTSDLIAEMLHDKTFIGKLREQAPEVIKPLLDILDEVITKVKLALGKDDSVLPYIENLEKLRNELSPEYASYLETVQGERMAAAKYREGWGKAAKVTESGSIEPGTWDKINPTEQTNRLGDKMATPHEIMTKTEKYSNEQLQSILDQAQARGIPVYEAEITPKDAPKHVVKLTERMGLLASVRKTLSHYSQIEAQKQSLAFDINVKPQPRGQVMDSTQQILKRQVDELIPDYQAKYDAFKANPRNGTLYNDFKMVAAKLERLLEEGRQNPDPLLYNAENWKHYSEILDSARNRKAIPDTAVKGEAVPEVADNINTPEFRKWFGDSKVVDESGKPLVVYHGTRGDFSTFNTDLAGKGEHSMGDPGIAGKGFYFTTDHGLAEAYPHKKGSGHNIMPVYLSIRNPYDRGLDPLGVYHRNLSPAEITNLLKNKGYDGVIKDLGGEMKEIVAFSPTQIKSVYNRGTFDPTNPDIRFKRNLTPEQEKDLEVLKVVAEQRKLGPFTINKAELAPEAMERPEFQAAGEIAEKLGLRLVTFRSKGGNRGAYHEGTLYINEGIKDPVDYVFLHEVTHSMQDFQPQHYGRLLDLSLEHLADAEGIDRHYLRQGYERADRPHEFAADVFAEAMSTPGFFARVAEQAPELIKPLLEAIDRLIANVKGMVSKDDTIIPYMRDWEVLRQRIREEVAMPYFKDAMGENQFADTFGKQLKGPAAKAKAETVPEVADNINTPEFRKWFGDSKVVDESGKPLVVYHGTDSDFTAFNMEKGKGMAWLTGNKDYAHQFAGKGNEPMQVYASIKKPVDARDFTEELSLSEWKAILDDMGADTNRIDWDRVDFAPEYGLYYWYDLFPHAGNNYADGGVLRALKQLGYDGMITPDEAIDGVSSGVNFVAFSPTQIKSVYNRGTWDKTNPDIRFKLGEGGKSPVDDLKAMVEYGAGQLHKGNYSHFIKLMEKQFPDELAGYSPEITERLMKDVYLRAKELRDTGQTQLEFPGQVVTVRRGEQGRTLRNTRDMDNSPDMGEVDTRQHIVSKTQREPIIAKESAKMVYTKAFDDLYRLDELDKFVARTTGKHLPAEDKAYLLAINSREATGAARAILEENLVDAQGNIIGKSFKEVLGNIPKGKEQEFRDYLVLRNAISWMEQGKKVYPEKWGMTPEKAMQRLAAYDQQIPELKQVADEYVNWHRDMAKSWLVDTGIITPEMWEAFLQAHPHYTPFQRQMKTIETTPGQGKARRGFANQTNPTKKAEGSERPIIDPIESTIEQVDRYIKTAKRNEVMQAVVRNLEKAPEELEGFAEIIPDKKMDMLDDVNAILNRDGIDGVINYLEEPFEQMMARLAKSEQPLNKPNIVRAFVNGERVHVKVNDPVLLDALTALSDTGRNAIVETFRTATRMMKVLTTGGNPIFAARNIARDVPMAYVASETLSKTPVVREAQFAWGMIDALARIVTKEKWHPDKFYREYKAMGGGSHTASVAADRNILAESKSRVMPGYWSPKNNNPLTYVGKGAKAGFQGIERFTSTVEALPRLPEYIRTVKKGGNDYASKLEGLHASQDVTVNFSRRGNISKDADAFIPYFNAAVQGIEKIARMWGSDPIGATYRSLVAVTIPTVGLYLLNKDNPNYHKLSSIIRDNYYCIPIQGGEKFIKIAKPREIGVVFSDLPERALRQWEADDPEGFYQFSEAWINNFVPPIRPIVMPAADILANKDFAGRPIVPGYMEGLSPELQYDEKTSAAAKAIGNALKLSPKQIDYLFRSYTGVIGELGIPAMAQGQGQNAAQRTGEVLKRTFTADPLYSNDITNKFYEQKEKYDTAAKDYKATGNKGEYYDPGRQRYFNRQADRISNIRKEIRKVNADPSLSYKEKEKRTRRMQANMLEIAQKAVEDRLSPRIAR